MFQAAVVLDALIIKTGNVNDRMLISEPRGRREADLVPRFQSLC